MNSIKPFEQSNNFSGEAVQSADQAKKSTASLANDGIGSLSDTLKDIRQQAAPMLNRTTEQASELAQRGVDSVLDTSHQLKEKALRASHNSVNYIKEEPVKSMLIAAATGAALMALVSLVSRSRDHR